jgi:YD repeat-containing protein
MTRAIFVALLASVAFLYGSPAAIAQGGSPCYKTYAYNWWGSGPGAGWICELENDTGVFSTFWLCTQQTSACPPAAAHSESAPGTVCTHCGSPISLDSGNTYFIDTDLKVPGLSNGLALSRTWNSMWTATQNSFKTGLFGPSWRSNYEERVFFGSDGFYKYSRGDGSFWSFGITSSSGWTVAAPANVIATLSFDSSTYTIAFQNGEKRIFDYTSGVLKFIVDRNGNSTQLSYDSLNRLVTIGDPGGRHLYFGYANNSSYLVTSVTSDVGISLSYSYDTQGRLTQVTKPDQTTTTYQYDSNSMLTAVKDSDGKIIESHTYDTCGRGLSSARANSVEAITLSYPQPCWIPASFSALEDHGLP